MKNNLWCKLFTSTQKKWI